MRKFHRKRDGLYIGGGFPEEFAEELAQKMRYQKFDSKQQLQAGLPTLAECGGFMYLTESIANTDWTMRIQWLGLFQEK